MTQPTERSMPAAMMTKVWPSPSSSTGMIATRMFWELRTVRKLTAPPVVSGTATTKNRMRRARNSPRPDAAEEQNDALSAGAHAGGAADARVRVSLDARSVTSKLLGLLELRRTALVRRRSASPGSRPEASLLPRGRGETRSFEGFAGKRTQAGATCRHLIDETGDRGSFTLSLSMMAKPVSTRRGRLVTPAASAAANMHRDIAHVERFLRQHQRHDALVHQFDRLFGGVVGDDLDVAAEPGVDDRGAGALAR